MKNKSAYSIKESIILEFSRKVLDMWYSPDRKVKKMVI